MKTYLINLTERTDRLQSATEEFRKIGLDFERVEAISADTFATSSQQFVTAGVKACWESHKLCYTKLIASGEQYALICEDDLKIMNVKHFRKSLEWAIHKNIDIMQVGFLLHGVRDRLLFIHELLEGVVFKLLYLTTRISPLRATPLNLGNRLRVIKYGATPIIFSPDSYLPGTHCYLISRETAGKILQLNDPQFLSADEFLISLAGMRTFSMFRTRKSTVTQSDSPPSIESRFIGVKKVD